MKNLSKKILAVSILMILMLICMGQTLVFATDATTNPKYLGVVELKTKTNMGYGMGDPGTNGQIADAAKIWNIVQYSSLTANEFTEINSYCLKAGAGFTNGTDKKETYNIYYDMKTERDAMAGSKNDILKGLVAGKYNELLALIDILYVPGQSTEGEKDQLMESAGIDFSGEMGGEPFDPEFAMTDDDIEAIQQAVIWYFTNGTEEPSLYDKTSNTHWLNYTTDGIHYTSLSDYYSTTASASGNNDAGLQRQEQGEKLYKYLIETATANADKYKDSTGATTAPITVNTKTIEYTTSGSNTIYGPFNITKNNDIPYNIAMTVSNGSSNITNYTLLDKDKNAVTSGTTVNSLVGQNFYISVPSSEGTKIKVKFDTTYSKTSTELWASTTDTGAQPILIIDKKEQTDSVELSTTGEFDLALRKYITKINDKDVSSSRVPDIEKSSLESGTTATYKHRKDPVTIENGDKVTYNLTIYNEGSKSGRATKIVDQLPTGLEYVSIITEGFTGTYDKDTNRLEITRDSSNTTNLDAYSNGTLDSETITIECKVTATADSAKATILTNVAFISEEYNADDDKTITTVVGDDRDSEPGTTPNVNKDNMSDYKGNDSNKSVTPGDSTYFYKGQQDDDDFEKLVLMPKAFDLKLIKRITEVNGTAVPERIESVDVSKLNTTDANGEIIKTGDYKLSKDPVSVNTNDIVTYTFRIYNEGQIDGYASEITEDIPEGLQFLYSAQDDLSGTDFSDAEKEAIEFNRNLGWAYSDDTLKTVSTSYLSKDSELTPGGNLIEAFGDNDGTKTEADIKYKEISIKLKVISTDTTSIIRNEAAITGDSDKDGNDVEDRDSKTDKWVKYEDDEDYDNIKLQAFDLALRKFIIAVSHDATIETADYLRNDDGTYTRAPIVDTSKLNTLDENGKLITTATYNHSKTPVQVTVGDTVVYMLRVYNEGDVDGYAAEIKDHLPEYLEFVDGDFNKEYGWAVSDDGRTVTTTALDDELINKATTNTDGNIVLTYKEVPIMCKVKTTATSNYKITNIADITVYEDGNGNPANDRDSQINNVVLPSDQDLPNYKDDETGEYIPGQQDDDDFEKVIVKIFDLALRKWVTQAIVIENGVETVTDTGHDAWDEPEEIVKVDLHRKKLNSVIVKFRYSIRVYNQGDIAGYAKEITDTIPEGLQFLPEDNPQWVDQGNGTVATDALANTLLQPGESADVEILLTWYNSADNIGLKVNTAEISKDYNDQGVPDIDSVPGNNVPGEDDIDTAPVMLSIATGAETVYWGLGLTILVAVAGGVILIKKYVL